MLLQSRVLSNRHSTTLREACTSGRFWNHVAYSSQAVRRDTKAEALRRAAGNAPSPVSTKRKSRTSRNAAKNLTDKTLIKERNKQLLLEHLADFVAENQQWLHGHFPTREYLSNAGRIDLAEAIRKLGGPAKVADMFGLKWGMTGIGGCQKKEREKGYTGIQILDKRSLEKAITENVENGQTFMIEHTSSKTPMKENFWTLWKPPISASTTQETLSSIFEESSNCSRHNPQCYVRIAAFDKSNMNQKITFLIHAPAVVGKK